MQNKMHKLLQLAVDNKDVPSKKFKVENTADDEATIYLYDAIDPWWGISAESFIKALNEITASTIHLRINSPGGDVFEARAIATAIKQHSATIKAHIDGIAASAATYVATSASEVEIAEGAFFMIHFAWTFALGNADELRETADLLDKVDGTIVADYAKKTGAEDEQLRNWMAAETWFTAQEALEHGFVDSIFTDDSAASNRGQWQLSAYDNTPQALTEKHNHSSSPDREKMARRIDMLERIG